MKLPSKKKAARGCCVGCLALVGLLVVVSVAGSHKVTADADRTADTVVVGLQPGMLASEVVARIDPAQWKRVDLELREDPQPRDLDAFVAGLTRPKATGGTISLRLQRTSPSFMLYQVEVTLEFGPDAKLETFTDERNWTD